MGRRLWDAFRKLASYAFFAGLSYVPLQNGIRLLELLYF